MVVVIWSFRRCAISRNPRFRRLTLATVVHPTHRLGSWPSLLLRPHETPDSIHYEPRLHTISQIRLPVQPSMDTLSEGPRKYADHALLSGFPSPLVGVSITGASSLETSPDPTEIPLIPSLLTHPSCAQTVTARGKRLYTSFPRKRESSLGLPSGRTPHDYGAISPRLRGQG